MKILFYLQGLLILCLFPFQSLSAEFVLIVNSENPQQQISESDVRDYYLKKKRNWPNGNAVRFIDRASNSRLRREFLDKVVEKTPEDMDLYWIGQKLYSGDSSPLQEASEEMVIQFVSTFDGAIGYVSNTASIDSKKVKVIPIFDLD